MKDKYQQLLREELARQEQRRRKFLEAGLEGRGGAGAKGARRPGRRTCRQRLAFYATSSLALVAIGGGCALLFLVPLYVDPAFSTLSADFFPEPVICTTSKREDLWGLFNCTWSSCREGCTSEVYRCTHIYVTYTPWSNESSPAEPPPYLVDAVLLVNIKGCGYPPLVDCDNFTSQLGYEGSSFPCYYSRANGSIVLAEYDREAELEIIKNYFAVPLVATITTTALLCVWHCDCRCQPPPKRHHQHHQLPNVRRYAPTSKKTTPNQTTSATPRDISEHSISTRVERRGHPVHCECGEVMRPL